MRLCDVCKHPLKINDKVVVIAFPITLKTHNGDYSLVDDFIPNEKIIHLSCYSRLESFQTEKPLRKPENSLLKDIYTCLRQLGEDVTIEKCKRFIDKYSFDNKTEPGEVIKCWYQNRSNF